MVDSDFGKEKQLPRRQMKVYATADADTPLGGRKLPVVLGDGGYRLVWRDVEYPLDVVQKGGRTGALYLRNPGDEQGIKF